MQRLYYSWRNRFILFLQSTCTIASALQNPQNAAVKKSAKKAMTMLRGTAADLSSDEDLVDLCNQLTDLMGKVF